MKRVGLSPRLYELFDGAFDTVKHRVDERFKSYNVSIFLAHEAEEYECYINGNAHKLRPIVVKNVDAAIELFVQLADEYPDAFNAPSPEMVQSTLAKLMGMTKSIRNRAPVFVVPNSAAMLLNPDGTPTRQH